MVVNIHAGILELPFMPGAWDSWSGIFAREVLAWQCIVCYVLLVTCYICCVTHHLLCITYICMYSSALLSTALLLVSVTHSQPQSQSRCSSFWHMVRRSVVAWCHVRVPVSFPSHHLIMEAFCPLTLSLEGRGQVQCDKVSWEKDHVHGTFITVYYNCSVF